MKDGFVIDENFDMDYLDPDEFLDGLGLMFIFNLKNNSISKDFMVSHPKIKYNCFYILILLNY